MGKFALRSRGYRSPRWSYEFPDCAMPMTFDTYGNCGFECAYCFSANQRAIGGVRGDTYKARCEIDTVNVELIKRLFRGDPALVNRRGKYGFESGGFWQFDAYIKARRMMQWGGLSDPFCSIEREHGVGLELMRFFREIEYPISFSTKGTWFLDDPRYVEVLQGATNWHFKVSIITGDAGKAARIERGVRSPNDRLRAIERLSKLLGRTDAVTLRLRPFIIGVSNPSHMRLIADAGNAGAVSVSTEFLCMEGRLQNKKPYERISRECGFDIYKFYLAHTRLASGYMRLNRDIKRQYVEEMREAATGAGMRLHISDAHFKEAGDSGCCCGMDDSWPWSRGQLCEALQIARRRGVVRWSDIGEHLGFADTFGFRYAEGYNTAKEENRAKYAGKTMKSFLRSNWNNTKAATGPYRFFGGVLRQVEVDEQGDLVYQFVDLEE